jgi:hypothetical protein
MAHRACAGGHTYGMSASTQFSYDVLISGLLPAAGDPLPNQRYPERVNPTTVWLSATRLLDALGSEHRADHAGVLPHRLGPVRARLTVLAASVAALRRGTGDSLVMSRHIILSSPDRVAYGYDVDDSLT